MHQESLVDVAGSGGGVGWHARASVLVGMCLSFTGSPLLVDKPGKQ